MGAAYRLATWFPQPAKESKFNCQFNICHVKVTFLGHVVGQGQVAPVSKIEAIAKFPIPEDKKDLMRFLEMADYYHKLSSFFVIC